MSTIIITFAPLKQKEMNEKPLFEIEVLEEAQEFIESLTPEARKKIYRVSSSMFRKTDAEITH